MTNRLTLLCKSFLKAFRSSLKQKHVMLNHAWLKAAGNKIFLNIEVFFQYKRINVYRKKVRECISHKKNGALFFKETLKFFGPTVTCTVIHNLNKNIDKKKTQVILMVFRKFKNILFIRRNGLFSDFVNVSYLLSIGKVKVEAYLILLAEIFTVVLKNRHSQFFLMVNTIFKEILKQKTGIITGLKFVLNGKLKGKPRTGTFRALVGRVPCQQSDSLIEFSKINTYNRYGAYGFKL